MFHFSHCAISWLPLIASALVPYYACALILLLWFLTCLVLVFVFKVLVLVIYVNALWDAALQFHCIAACTMAMKTIYLSIYLSKLKKMKRCSMIVQRCMKDRRTKSQEKEEQRQCETSWERKDGGTEEHSCQLWGEEKKKRQVQDEQVQARRKLMEMDMPRSGMGRETDI